MKVLHITNEFTKKNFSIASLILFISKQLHNTLRINYSILASSCEERLFKDANIEILKFSSWLNFFSKTNNLYRKLSKHEIIHIHGIWAPIQLLSIIICSLSGKKYVIHPHGMLLIEALKSAGIFKYLLKISFLYFFKYFISDKIRFVAITTQENEAIRRYFPNGKIKKISNPIPFTKHLIDNQEKKKQFVYFGRIHPHKNIDLIMKAFKASKLNEEWELKIYGIHDDLQYLKKLKKIIQSDIRIKIYEPVFEKEKQLILKNSWANILISNSEVLSLSILESSMCGLPSLVNKNIETIGIEESVLLTGISINEIKKNLELISNWTIKYRLDKEQEIITCFKKIDNIENISQNYEALYEDLLFLDRETRKQNKYKFFENKNYKFLIYTANYTFNLMFSSFVVISLVVFGNFKIAGELGLVSSFWITLTQIFSSNMRSIIISESKTNYAIMSILYRSFFSIVIFLFSYLIILQFIEFENLNLIILFSILILIQWINEMSLVIAEIKNKNIIFKNLTYLNFITILCTTIFIFYSKFEFLAYLILIYIVIIGLFILSSFFNSEKKDIDFSLNKIINLNIRTTAFLSSLSIVISSFAWRIMIYFYFDKALAGVFFACFSVGSFPGTLFNAIIGPTYIKDKINLPNNLKKVFLILFLIVIIFFFYNLRYLLDNQNIDYLGIQFISLTISISMLGSFFMCYAMFLRHKKIQSSSLSREYLFKRDIVYGLSITLLIPVLYNFGNIIGVSFSFFLASLIALLAYSFNLKYQNSLK